MGISRAAAICSLACWGGSQMIMSLLVAALTGVLVGIGVAVGMKFMGRRA